MSIKTKNFLIKGACHTILIFAAVFSVFPFVWMIRSSLMNSVEIFVVPIRWLPEKVMWGNFREALTSEPFARYFLNTIFIVLMNTIGNLFCSTFAAFGFTRISFKGRDVIFGILIATMMIPSTAILIPQFLGWNAAGLYNTYVPLILPSFFVNAFFTFMMKQFFAGIPREYDESAFIDGAGYLRIYRSIILPLSKPSMVTVAVFTFMWTWNDFFSPLIYLKDAKKYTLALGLQSFMGEHVSKWNLLMAAASVAIVPMILVYFLAQKAFVQGITFSGVKG